MPAEASAVWQWYRSLVRVLPGTKRILHLNMDETSVAAFHGDSVGNIASWKKRGPEAEPIVWADRKKRRTAYTHCAFICDDPAIQPLLPQLILANEHTLRVTELRSLLENCPPNVFVKRLKSSWINREVLKTLLRVLNEILRPFKETRHVVLFMDARKAHFHSSIAEYCARTDLHLVILPARLTWLMQPCDAHLFARYKKFLKRRYHEMARESESGVVDALALFKSIFETIRGVQNAVKWRSAFAADGFSADLGGVSSYIKRHLGYSALPEISDAEPPFDVLKHCFPKGSHIPVAPLLRVFRQQGRQLALPPASVHPALALAPGPEAPVVARGRRLFPQRPRPAASSSSSAWPRPQPAAPAVPLSRTLSQLMEASTEEEEEAEERPRQQRRVLPWTLRSQR